LSYARTFYLSKGVLMLLLRGARVSLGVITCEFFI
jgi:hypothetical protein